MRRPCSLALVALLLLAACPAAAQPQPAFARARAAAAQADSRARAMQAAAAGARGEADRLAATAAAAAAEVQAGEARLALATTRLTLIERARTVQRAELARRQAPIARVLGALQTMARRPPATALVEPGSLRDMVHVRALLRAALPAMAARTAGLKAAIARNAELAQAAAAAIAALRTERAGLDRRRTELARIEQQARLRSTRLAGAAMLETERAQGLAEQARDIAQLMGEMDQQADLRERLAALPGPLLRPAIPGGEPSPPPAPPPPEGRQPAYRVPVIGTLVSGLGEAGESGIRARGITIATAPGAQVVAPAAGRISFAGPFKGYGAVVIIDHGGGWTSSLTDLAAATVRVGDVIAQGGPIGRMGAVAPRLTIELRHGGRPVDVARLVSHG